MPRGNESKPKKETKARTLRRARSPEERENQLIAMAYDEAERQLRDGTISAQALTHFLKLGSLKTRYEMEILQEQKKLYSAKTESIESTKRVADMFEDAMEAFRSYSGQDDYDDENL